MGDNELIEEVVSPTESQGVDLSPIVNTLQDLLIKQGEILESQEKTIKNQEKIIEYFIPSDEELKQQEELEKKEQEQLEIEEIELEKELEQKELEQEQYQQELITLLGKIEDNTLNNTSVSTVNSTTNYLLLFVIVGIFILYLLYRAIRYFI